MSLPTLTKTWEYNVNQVVGASGLSGNAGAQADAQSLLWKAKESFKNVSLTTPWTVQGSSDGSTSGMDGVDRLTSSSLWGLHLFPTNVIGWCVLRQAAITSKFEIVWWINGSTNGNNFFLSMKISPNAGFGTANGGTNGSTTTPPTATDEILVINQVNNIFSGQNALPFSGRLHFIQSTDGKACRLMYFISGVCHFMWTFEVPQSPATGWTTPWTSLILQSNSATPQEMPTYANTFSAANLWGKFTNNFNAYMGVEGVNNSALGQVATSANDLTSEFVITPIGITSLSTSPSRGRLGIMTDLYFGSNVLASGSSFPSNATRLFMTIRDLIIPWNGTTLLVS